MRKDLTNQKVVIITGANSGIGFETLQTLVGKGYDVYGSARKKVDLKKIEAAGAKSLEIEMSDYKSIEKAVKKVIKERGQIDVLLNNAGYGLYGTVEETTIDDAKEQFDTNLFGLARITQLVLPHMRLKKSGIIINVSSMAGRVYMPLGAWYIASKHALEGWSDCLRLEVAQFGIKVVVIEPGGIKTPWGARAADNVERISSKGAYKEFGKRTATGMRKTFGDNGRLSPPSVIANTVLKAISSDRPKTRYAAGKYSRTLMFIRKYGGDRLYDKIITKAL